MTEKRMAVRPQDTNHDANAQDFMFRAMLNKNAFIQIVRVEKVKATSEGGPPLVNVTPLVLGFSGEGTPIDSSQVFNIPVWRLQRGSSAVIMDPVIGDIGLMLCCDRDTSRVRETKKEDMPGSSRTHNEADGIYLGGILSSDPVQYVRFADDGIDVVSPLTVRINAPITSVSDDLQVGGKIIAAGDVTAGGISLMTHVHNGVQSVGSNTGKPQ